MVRTLLKKIFVEPVMLVGELLAELWKVTSAFVSECGAMFGNFVSWMNSPHTSGPNTISVPAEVVRKTAHYSVVNLINMVVAAASMLLFNTSTFDLTFISRMITWIRTPLQAALEKVMELFSQNLTDRFKRWVT
jgi:hypothetical protein